MIWLLKLRPLLPYLAVVAVVALLGSYVAHLRNRAETAETQVGLLELNLAGQEAARQALHQDRLNAEAAYREREARHGAIAATLARTRSELAEALQQPDVAPWADARVPDGVRELLRAATAASAGRDIDPTGRAD